MTKEEIIKKIENLRDESQKEKAPKDSHAFYLQLGRKMAFDDALRIISELRGRPKRYRD